MAISVLKLKL